MAAKPHIGVRLYTGGVEWNRAAWGLGDSAPKRYAESGGQSVGSPDSTLRPKRLVPGPNLIAVADFHHRDLGAVDEGAVMAAQVNQSATGLLQLPS